MTINISKYIFKVFWRETNWT